MIKKHAPSETGEMVCPACGAAIKGTSSARRRRVQCPKCREVVFIGNAPAPEPEAPPPPSAAPSAPEADGNRLDLLEARVEALEAALRDAMTAARPAEPTAPQRKLIWITTTPGSAPEFSPEQGHALFHNLGGVRSQAITIRTPTADPMARLHAEWFKSIFERAGWTVHGPDEIPPGTSVAGLSLAVPELPVAKDAAATYLALKAAGFEANPILDSAPRGEAGQPAAAMALMLPGKAA